MGRKNPSKCAFEPIAAPESKLLILGTMPGERSLQLQQYYGHKSNQFWRLMFDVFQQPWTDNYADRVDLLIKNKVALWDVLSHCEREGSADSAIKNEIVNDFGLFYKLHPGITHVFFDSRTAEKLYDRHRERSPDHTYALLPSPSSAYASMPYAAKLKEWEMILKVLR